MKAGRNDPCPCGSGKKYKKCCLPKDEAKLATQTPKDQAVPPAAPKAPPAPPLPLLTSPKARPEPVVAAPPRPLPLPPRKPPPPREKTPFDLLWEEFEKRDYEGRVALFHETLHNPELMDEEMAFEMTAQLQTACLQGERRRIIDLIGALREQRPEVFAAKADYYLSVLLGEALVAEQAEEVRRLGLELAVAVGDDLDLFQRDLDRLAYHGQLSLLLEMMRLALPAVASSTDLLPWASKDFAYRLSLYEMFAWLEQNPVTAEVPAALRERLQAVVEDLDDVKLTRYWKLLTGQEPAAWTLADFAMQPPRRRRDRYEDDEDDEEAHPDPGRKNVTDLCTVFLGYLRREEQVFATRAYQASEQLGRYFQERVDGELEETEGFFQRSNRSQRPRVPVKPEHPLCPDRATLDRFLGGLLQFLSSRYHEVAATFELLPAWLRFLEARKLLTPEQHHKTLQELAPLVQNLRKLWESYVDDPTLKQSLRTWETPGAASV